MSDIREASFWKRLIKKIARIILKNLGADSSSGSRNQHVVPHEDGWAVRGEGNTRLTATYKYQDDAIKRAEDIATNSGSSVVIHRKDGSIRDRISFSDKKFRK